MKHVLQAFTGDTLFIGSCGRPDLVGSIGYTSEYMSKLMFNSLSTKIATLPDHVKVSDVETCSLCGCIPVVWDYRVDGLSWLGRNVKW